jgi:hypothetical protein
MCGVYRDRIKFDRKEGKDENGEILLHVSCLRVLIFSHISMSSLYPIKEEERKRMKTRLQRKQNRKLGCDLGIKLTMRRGKLTFEVNRQEKRQKMMFLGWKSHHDHEMMIS